MKVFHAFSGVDSQLMAERRVFSNVMLIGTMEVDIDAIISCALVHHKDRLEKELLKDLDNDKVDFARKWLKERNIGFDFDKGKSKIDRLKLDRLKLLFLSCLLTRNYGDISLANKRKIIDDIDLFTYSSPCQSFSVAGKQEGLQGTSGLLLECEKFIEINKPKFLLLENVKNLVGKKFIKDFENWLSILDKLGYNSYWKVLNAKNFGVPQNRERVFCLSIRKDIDKGFNFPKEFPLTIRLKDLLDDEVDSKYFLKDTAKFFINNSFAMEQKGNGFRFAPHVHDKANIAKCLTTKAGSRMDDNYIIDVESKNDKFEFSSKNDELKAIRLFGLFDKENSKHQAGSVWDKEGLAPTLDTMQGGYRQPLIVENTDKIIKVDIQQQVEVRKHEINQDELYNFLKEHKIKSNQQIADELNIPKTKVDHWFRNDESFSIPTRDIWFKLKEILNIKSDRFDKAIMEFDIKDGVYEKSNRCYLPHGIAPTLTTQCEEKIIDYNNFHIRKLTPNECWKLMDFDKDAFNKVKGYISDSQLYKIAGNSICVSCLEYIFKEIKTIYKECD